MIASLPPVVRMIRENAGSAVGATHSESML